MGSKGSADFYDCGWWAASRDSIDYTLTLEPGNYVVATGYQEWWNTNRNISVTVTSVDAEGNARAATQIGYSAFRLRSTEQGLQVNTEITVPEDSEKVIVSVTRTSGSDAVLSWIGVIGEELNLPPVDKSALQDAIDSVEELAEADYTEESWADLQTALENAVNVNDNADASQEEVDAAAAALEEAIANLVEKSDDDGSDDDGSNDDESDDDGSNDDGSDDDGSNDDGSDEDGSDEDGSDGDGFGGDDESDDDESDDDGSDDDESDDDASVETGDHTPIAMYSVIAIISMLVAIMVIKRRKMA